MQNISAPKLKFREPRRELDGRVGPLIVEETKITVASGCQEDYQYRIALSFNFLPSKDLVNFPRSILQILCTNKEYVSLS